MQALALCPTRNLVAHGSFALDGTQQLQPGQDSRFLLHSLMHDQPASLGDIEKATKGCIDLSDNLSEAIAIVEMKKARITPKNG